MVQCCKVFNEKLIVTLFVKEILTFMASERSLSCSQKHTVGFSAIEFIPVLQILFLLTRVMSPTLFGANIFLSTFFFFLLLPIHFICLS